MVSGATSAAGENENRYPVAPTIEVPRGSDAEHVFVHLRRPGMAPLLAWAGIVRASGPWMAPQH
jgi:hypothetical protein